MMFSITERHAHAPKCFWKIAIHWDRYIGLSCRRNSARAVHDHALQPLLQAISMSFFRFVTALARASLARVPFTQSIAKVVAGCVSASSSLACTLHLSGQHIYFGLLRCMAYELIHSQWNACPQPRASTSPPPCNGNWHMAQMASPSPAEGKAASAAVMEVEALPAATCG